MNPSPGICVLAIKNKPWRQGPPEAAKLRKRALPARIAGDIEPPTRNDVNLDFVALFEVEGFY
jgi:hypothetical protein